MSKLIVLFVTLSLLVIGCKQVQADDTEQWIVASRMGDCVGVMPMKCLLIKRGSQIDWEFFYDQVDGFAYEPGYEYEIQVKRDTVNNPAQDQSSLKYQLIKVLSKKSKESDNLPEIN